MVQTCVAYGCNETAVKGTSLSFHSFPLDEVQRNKWIVALQRKDFTPSKYAKICSKHFTKDCFDFEAFGTGRKLKPNVVPSVFVFSKGRGIKRRSHARSVGPWKQPPKVGDVSPVLCVSKPCANPEWKHRHLALDRENINLKVQPSVCSKQFTHEFDDDDDIVYSLLLKDVSNVIRVPVQAKNGLHQDEQELHTEESQVTLGNDTDDLAIKREVLQDHLCRICAEYSDRLLPLFGHGSEADIVMKIHTHLPIMVTTEDILPLKICEDCHEKLDICHNLVNTCLTADEILRKKFYLLCEQNDAAFSIASSKPVMLTEPQTHSVNSMVQNDELDNLDTTPSDLNTLSKWPQYLKYIAQDGQSQILELVANTQKKKLTCSSSVMKVQQSLKNYRYCKKCSLYFGSVKKYFQHKTRCCLFKCPYCNRNFDGKRKLAEHELLHSGEKPYLCATCGKAFRDRSTLHHHTNIHQNRKYTCKQCGKEYNNRSGLYWHAWTHRDSTYLCEICGELVKKGSGVYAHKLKHSSLYKKRRKIFEDRVSEARQNGKLCCQTRHCEVEELVQNSDSQADQWTCEVCKQSFNDDTELKTHRESHVVEEISTYSNVVCSAEERSYASELCGSSFKHPRTLQLHKITHTEEKPFLCSVCGWSFPLRKQLNFHMKIHRDGAFVCQFCGLSFRSSNSLCYHERTHTNERPFSCNHCGKAFTSNWNLQQHLGSHTKRCIYKCTICGQDFRGKNRLTNHLKRHNQMRPYECELCGKTYKIKGMLRQHQHMHTSNKLDES